MMYFDNVVVRNPSLAPLYPAFLQALELLENCIRAGGKIIVCGNGGSAADAEHIVGELMKAFLLPRPLTEKQRNSILQAAGNDAICLADSLQQAIPAISLTSGVSLPTAFANDVNPEYIFAQQVLGLGKPGDVLCGISTSGNSPNILHALKVARAFGLGTVCLTGKDGGKAASLCDVELRAPAAETPIIQELHLPIYHALCADLEQRFFGNKESL